MSHPRPEQPAAGRNDAPTTAPENSGQDPMELLDRELRTRLAPGSIKMIREALIAREGRVLVFAGSLPEFLQTMVRSLYPAVRFEVRKKARAAG